MSGPSGGDSYERVDIGPGQQHARVILSFDECLWAKQIYADGYDDGRTWYLPIAPLDAKSALVAMARAKSEVTGRES